MIVMTTSSIQLPQKEEEKMRAKSYQLHIQVKTPVMVAIGKLGRIAGAASGCLRPPAP